ncbi:MAG: HD domain-containing protein [Hyphomicrobiales bacterium]|nr:HD domain-containing protein [Hyphomicrobiales bacterium]
MKLNDIDSLTADTIVPFISAIFDRRGAEAYLGEPVSMAEHMLQGAMLAERGGQDETVIVAALLHDIGHFTSRSGTFSMDDTEDKLHEVAGAELLQPFFPPVVVACVRHHVAAKRYLCATRADYFARLSEPSRHSLMLQGGPMTAAEVAAFERIPDHRTVIKVRYLDDAGKRAGVATPSFAHYAPMAQRLVDAHCPAG